MSDLTLSLPKSQPVSAMLDEFLRDGYVVVQRAYEPNALRDALSSRFKADTYEALHAAFEDEDLALGPSRTNFRVTKESKGKLLSSTLSELLSTIAQGGGWRWWDASIITALPGLGRQPAHRDYSMPEKASGQWKVVVFTPLNDVVANGGVTVVYPGTHFGGVAGGRGKRVRLAKGDALVFFSSLIHYGAANKTDADRILFSQTFEVHGPLLCDAAEAASAAERMETDG